MSLDWLLCLFALSTFNTIQVSTKWNRWTTPTQDSNSFVGFYFHVIQVKLGTNGMRYKTLFVRPGPRVLKLCLLLNYWINSCDKGWIGGIQQSVIALVYTKNLKIYNKHQGSFHISLLPYIALLVFSTT